MLKLQERILKRIWEKRLSVGTNALGYQYLNPNRLPKKGKQGKLKGENDSQ